MVEEILKEKAIRTGYVLALADVVKKVIDLKEKGYILDEDGFYGILKNLTDSAVRGETNKLEDLNATLEVIKKEQKEKDLSKEFSDFINGMNRNNG